MLQELFDQAKPGSILAIEPGTYYIDKPLNWTGKRITIQAEQVYIRYTGLTAGPIVTIGGMSSTIEGISVYGLRVEPDTAWIRTGIRTTGIRLQNLTHSHFYGLSAARSYVGVEFAHTCHYNAIYLRHIYNCKVGLLCTKEPNGYVISNQLFGGEISADTGITEPVIGMSCPLTGSAWTVSGVTFQAYNDITYLNINSRNNLFLNPYFESSSKGTVVFGPQSKENQILGGSTVYVSVTDQGQGNKWPNK